MLLYDTVPQLVGETLGQLETDVEPESVEVWHPDMEGELEVLSDSVMQLVTVAEYVEDTVLLVEAVMHAVEDTLGQLETEGEVDSVEVRQPDTEGEFEVLNETVTLLVPDVV